MGVSLLLFIGTIVMPGAPVAAPELKIVSREEKR
jgi:hypothetical protein